MVSRVVPPHYMKVSETLAIRGKPQRSRLAEMWLGVSNKMRLALDLIIEMRNLLAAMDRHQRIVNAQ